MIEARRAGSVASMRRLAVVAVLAVLAAATLLLATSALTISAAAAAAPVAPPQTIRWSDGRVTHIGAMKTNGSPTLTRAIRAFGTPSRRRLSGREVCIVDWNALGLRANFVNLGRTPPGKTTCSPGVGKLQTATIRGSSFQTQRGLKVGDSTARLRKLHPGARLRERSWWLASAPNPFGDAGERMAIVRANTQGAKVVNFVLRIGAAGE